MPSDMKYQAFLDAVNSSEHLVQVVKGLGFVDELATELLSEVLPEPHQAELARQSFLLKFDLAVALRVLHADVRPVATRINKIRNLFAHNASAVFAADDACDLFNVIPQRIRERLKEFHRDDPQYVLCRSVGLLYSAMAGAITQARDDKIRQAEWRIMVEEECIPESEYADHVRAKAKARQERVDLRAAEDRERRRREGRL